MPIWPTARLPAQARRRLLRGCFQASRAQTKLGIDAPAARSWSRMATAPDLVSFGLRVADARRHGRVALASGYSAPAFSSPAYLCWPGQRFSWRGARPCRGALPRRRARLPLRAPPSPAVCNPEGARLLRHLRAATESQEAAGTRGGHG